MLSFEKSFQTAQEVCEFLQSEAKAKRPGAFKVHQSPSIESPSRRNDLQTRVRFLEITHGKWEDHCHKREIARELLLPKEFDRLKKDLQTGIGGHSVSMNGQADQETEYKSRYPGITLKLLRWEEWWQAFGGGHIGGHDLIWLINQDQL